MHAHEQWNMSLKNMALFNVKLNIGGKLLFLLDADKGKINPISWDFFPFQAITLKGGFDINGGALKVAWT